MQKQIKKVLAAAVFAALFSSGINAVWADVAQPAAPPAKAVAATVNDQPITSAALLHQLSLIRLKYVTVEDRLRIALNQLLTDEVLFQNSTGKDLEKDPAVQTLIKDAQRPLLIDAMRNKLLEQVQADDQIKQYYLAHPEEFRRIHVSHILVSDPKQAQDLYQQIKDGADFAELARKYSLDIGTQERGGDLGYMSQGEASQPFEKQVFALKAGEVSVPVMTGLGYHLIKVDSISDEPPLEALSPRELAGVKYRIFRDQINAIESQDKISVHPELVAPNASSPTPETVFATVNDTVIDPAYYEKAIGLVLNDDKRVYYSRTTGHAEFLDQIVEDEALYQEAQKIGLDKDPLVQPKLAFAARPFMINALRASLSKKSDSEVKKYYTDNPGHFSQIRASHILTNQKEDIEEVYKQLQAGADFSKLAKERSIDVNTADSGGDLGVISVWQHVDKDIEKAALSLKVNEFSAPFSTINGYHVLKVTDIQPPPPIDTLPDLVLPIIKDEMVDQEMIHLADTAKIVINENQVAWVLSKQKDLEQAR